MSFKRVNNITGWLVFFIAFATYFLTREARGSLWDTGEFIASAKGMQLPHPPGAPMFVLLGRFFIILFGDKNAASAVNFMSALASAATILFLFWTITHFARKMFVGVGEQLTSNQLFTTMAAGVVGGLAYTFSDSFWFSAVEGEVYALSSFFTALVFWIMLKWEHADELAGKDPHARAKADRWIVLFFFMMGLSVGVHLLNLLCIPAAMLIYYYRRRDTLSYASLRKNFIRLSIIGGVVGLIGALVIGSGAIGALSVLVGGALIGLLYLLESMSPKNKEIMGGTFIFFLIGCIITGLVQVVIIQYSMKAAGQFDVFFVNTAGLPFFSGFAIYFIAIGILILWALRFQERNSNRGKMMLWFALFLALSLLPFAFGKGSMASQIFKLLLVGGVGVTVGYFIKPAAIKILKLSLWCYAFMMLGYFMYFTALIRSNANPTIDMNNVDNPINLVYYLSREQYGEAPLLYGPHFAAQYKYGDDGYVELKEGEMKYVKGKDRYIQTGREKKPQYESKDMQLFPRIWDSSNDQFHAEFYADWLGLKDEQGKYIPPTLAHNVNWFFSYQNGLMYWRYFMWNFAGKQNDIQGLGNKRDGNWISGIPMIDNLRLGDQSKLPDSIKNNKAHNKLYMLPFLLGVLGCVYQFFKNRKDWIVNFLLFFMTGMAIVFYLNQPGNQPRERDYAYVGSFFAFAVWIGLAVVAFVKLAKEKIKTPSFQNTLIAGTILTFFITLMSSPPGIFGDMFMISIYAAILFAVVTVIITSVVKAISSGGQNEKTLNLATAVICLAVPLLMAQQEWDDHDRSRKTTAPDIAKDYLESCAPNAVIFTFGDNDTYPLWYAQEVEGVRPDIRVINNSLLGIDWYINQLRYKVNEADSLDVIWSEEQIEGHNREYMRYKAKGDPNRFYDLYYVMKTVLGQRNEDENGRDVGFGNFPVTKFTVPVDTAFVRKNGTVNPDDIVLPELKFELPKEKTEGGMVRSDFIILNIIATNQWKRPIYFTSAFGELGFGQYLRKDGLSYRLVPILAKAPQQNWLVHSALRDYGLGGTQIRDNNMQVIYNNLMTKYEYGGANKGGIYFDEENRRHLLNLRSLYGEAAGNLADAGRKDEAGKLIDKIEAGIPPESIPYSLVSRFGSHDQNAVTYLEACYKAGKTELAEKVRKDLRKNLEQLRAYFTYMNGGTQPVMTRNGVVVDHKRFESLTTEFQINEALLRVLDEVEKRYAPDKQVKQPVENAGPTISTDIKPDSANKPDSQK